MKKILFLLSLGFVCFLPQITLAETIPESGKANVYVIFATRGYGGPGGMVSSPVTNDQLLQNLKNACGEIDFTGRDLTRPDITAESVLSEVKSQKDKLDGMVVVGSFRDYRLAFTGLPTIIVYNIHEFMNIPYKLFLTGEENESILVGGNNYSKGKILTASLDRLNSSAEKSSGAMFQDLLEKIRLFQVIKELKESRILVLTPMRYLAEVDYQGDLSRRFPENYNENYTREVKRKLGVELVKADPEEFYQAVRDADQEQARQLAKKWIDEAVEMTDTTESEVAKCATGYLATEALRQKYNCNAVSTHMRSLTGSGEIEDLFNPGLGLMEFQKRGIQAICQEYTNIMLAHLMGYFMEGRPSMLGDYMIDPFHKVCVVTHCGAPLNFYGDERRLSYTIKSHAESPMRGTMKPGSSTGAQVDIPAGEPVTIWKVYVLHNKIGLHTGTTVDGNSLYKNLDEFM